MSMSRFAVADSEQQISALGVKLKDKPKSAKLHAKLALLIYEAGGPQSQEEATCLAQKAIDLAPDKPVGFAALANVAADHKIRMAALQKAVDVESKHLTSENKPPTIGITLALVKLLSDPREDEAKALRESSRRGGQSIGKASPKHPNRRNLSEKEDNMYHRLREALDVLETSTANEKESLGWIHSKLGSST